MPLFARAVHREVNHLLYDPQTHAARDDALNLALLTVYFDQPLYLETWVQVTTNKTDGNRTSAEKTEPKWRPQRIPLLQVLQDHDALHLLSMLSLHCSPEQGSSATSPSIWYFVPSKAHLISTTVKHADAELPALVPQTQWLTDAFAAFEDVDVVLTTNMLYVVFALPSSKFLEKHCSLSVRPYPHPRDPDHPITITNYHGDRVVTKDTFDIEFASNSLSPVDVMHLSANNNEFAEPARGGRANSTKLNRNSTRCQHKISVERSVFIEETMGLGVQIMNKVVGTLLDPVVGQVVDMGTTNAMDTSNAMVTHGMVGDMPPMIAFHVSNTVPRNVSHTLTDSVTKALCEAVAVKLTNAYGPTLTAEIKAMLIPVLVTTLGNLVKDDIGDKLSITLPGMMERSLPMLLTYKVNKGVTQATVATLSQTLSAATSMLWVCQYCRFDAKYCKDCAALKQDADSNFFFANAYSHYYATYYGWYYQKAIWMVDYEFSYAKEPVKDVGQQDAPSDD